MNKTFVAVCVAALTLLTACGGGGHSTPAPQPQPQTQVAVAISPATVVTVAAKNTQQYTATVTGTTNTAVSWKVNGIAGGDETVGTVDVNGLYMAPMSPPDTASVTITATALADTTKSASSNAKVVFGDRSLMGPYVASFYGSDSTGTFYAIGSFGASGTGNLITGSLDFHKMGNRPEVITTVPFNGSYSVGPDGRGTFSMMTNTPTINESVGPHNFNLTLTTHQTGRVISASGTTSAQGTFNLQNTVDVSPATLAGSWVFRFGNRLGRMDLGPDGQITNAIDDVMGASFPGTPFSGTFSAAADSTGGLTINDSRAPANFVFRAITMDKLTILSSTPGSMHTGFMERQQPGPYSPASLKGDFALFDNGSFGSGDIFNGVYSGVAHFTSNGAGVISNGLIDLNSNANPPTQTEPIVGTYDISGSPIANGRGSVLLNPGPDALNMVLYMLSPTRAIFTDGNSSQQGSGQMYAQTGGPFSAASLKGNYAMYFSSFFVNAGSSMYSGQASLDGAGNLAGECDVYDAGVIAPKMPFGGTYTVSPDGRGSANIVINGSTTAVKFVIVSPTQLLIIGTDGAVVVRGNVDKRF